MIFFSFMDIILKNKFVYYKDYKAKCSIGKRGFTSNKKEGDKRTPKEDLKLNISYIEKIGYIILIRS